MTLISIFPLHTALKYNTQTIKRSRWHRLATSSSRIINDGVCVVATLMNIQYALRQVDLQYFFYTFTITLASLFPLPTAASLRSPTPGNSQARVPSVLLQVRDARQHVPMPVAEPRQLWQPRHLHGILLAHDLAQQARGGGAGQPGEVDRRLRVTVARQHAVLLCAQGEDVAGPVEVGWASVHVGEQHGGAGAVRGADASGDTCGTAATGYSRMRRGGNEHAPTNHGRKLPRDKGRS